MGFERARPGYPLGRRAENAKVLIGLHGIFELSVNTTSGAPSFVRSLRKGWETTDIHRTCKHPGRKRSKTPPLLNYARSGRLAGFAGRRSTAEPESMYLETAAFKSTRPPGGGDQVSDPTGHSYSGSDLKPPQRHPLLWRNFSRSSGVIRSQASAVTRRDAERPGLGPWPPQLPNRIRHRTSIPRACQKLIWCHPNSVGASQFHRCFTTSPQIATRSTIAGGATKKIHFFISNSSLPQKLVVNAL